MTRNPLQIVIYGSSLFLRAMAASLKQDPALELITLPAEARLTDILRHGPGVMLYQTDAPPAYLNALLASGVCCGELNTQYSSIVMHRNQHSQETYSLTQISDLLAVLATKE